MPILFVLFVSMIKDIIEDVKRHKQDRTENSRKTEILMPDNTWQQVSWKEITVGSIVRVKENQYFPADLALLTSSELKGICYVETKNLDGETNLKHKKAAKETVNLLKNGQFYL